MQRVRVNEADAVVRWLRGMVPDSLKTLGYLQFCKYTIFVDDLEAPSIILTVIERNNSTREFSIFEAPHAQEGCSDALDSALQHISQIQSHDAPLASDVAGIDLSGFMFSGSKQNVLYVCNQTTNCKFDYTCDLHVPL